MLANIFLYTGIAVWSAIVLYNLPKLVKLIPKSVQFSPTFYPITRTLSGRWMNVTHSLKSIFGLSKMPPAVRKSLGQVKLSQMKTLRDSYLELQELPSVQEGLKAIGYNDMFELEYKRDYWNKPSKFTHPMQRPMFYVPGVSAIPFYDDFHDKPGFEWARPLEKAFDDIKGEVENILDKDGVGFQNYQAEDTQMIQGWNTYNLFFFGKKFEDNCARCPKTTALLESFPNFEKDHIMFSALNPRSHIPPHFGPMNGILRVHLPLIVPDGCYMHVGPEIRKVEAGKLLVFDDAFYHEAWNHTDELRVILFLNFWHPDFRPQDYPVLERFRRAYEQHPLAQLHADNQELKRKSTIVKKQ